MIDTAVCHTALCLSSFQLSRLSRWAVRAAASRYLHYRCTAINRWHTHEGSLRTQAVREGSPTIVQFYGGLLVAHLELYASPDARVSDSTDKHPEYLQFLRGNEVEHMHMSPYVDESPSCSTAASLAGQFVLHLLRRQLLPLPLSRAIRA